MATLFIMCGLPFSGKSTLSKEISRQLGIPRVSFDETWTQVEEKEGTIPTPGSMEKWEYINKVCEERTKELLSGGNSVVYDNLSGNFQERERIRNLATDAGASSKTIYLDVAKDKVLERRNHNLQTKDRAQVDDENFNQAMEVFRPPTENEVFLTYNPSQNIDAWINEELNKYKTGAEKK